MSAWPIILPSPLRTVNILPGSKVASAEQLSGRRIARNWGHIPADQVTVQFRISKALVSEFHDFWNHTGMDGIWFTADWLTDMGYANHKARILGYPRRKGVDITWSDFAVTLLVYPSAYCVDGEAWPTTGEGST